METILIPVSQNAPKDKMKACIRLIANKETDKLHLLHVITYPSATGLVDAIVAQTDQIVEEMRAKEESVFKRFADDLIAEGYQVGISVPLGFFDQEFLDIASKVEPSLVLMFTSGSHSMIEDILGTNTSHIFKKLSAPVLVINGDAEITHFQRAVVGLPLENEDTDSLKKVFSFAEKLDMKLRFVKIDSQLQLDIINDESVLDHLQELYPGKIPNIFHHHSKNVGEGLQQYATSANADLIVLFTTKRNFVEKLFHKSVTRDLVLHAKKPVLIYHY